MALTGLMLPGSRYAVMSLKELPMLSPLAERRRERAVVLEMALASPREAAALGTAAQALVSQVRFARAAE